MNTDEMISKLGDVIDLPTEEFKQQIIEQKVPIGVLQNLRIMLTSAYNELNQRREALIDRMNIMNEEDKAKTEEVLKGVYMEMLRIEDKCIFLVERVKELLRLEEI